MRASRIVAGMACAALAGALTYAVPATADAAAPDAPAASPDAGHHLSPRLAALVAGDQPGTDSVDTGLVLTSPETGPGSLLLSPNGKRLVVDVRVSSHDDAIISALEAAGARLLPQPEGYGRVAVSVLPEDLTAVGDVAGVLYVGEEITPIVNAICDTTISAGDAILNADDLRATGVDGTGVKVGVLSDSFNTAAAPATNAAQDVVSDNLPGAANTCGHTSVSTIEDKATTGTDEGRAMMQIVHDVAPGAALDFETAFTSEPSFAAGITKLADQGADVIVDDVSYIDEPMYQDGIVEQAVTGVRARGVDYFSSSANNRYIKNGHEVGSYEAVDGYRPGTCPAIAAITATHTDCHNFGTAAAPDPTFGFSYNANQTLRPVIQWAEPWDGGIKTDLDFYLISTTTNTVVGTASQVNNLTSQQAFEWFAGTLPSAANLAFVVARKSNVAPSATPRFKFVMAGNGANPYNVLEHETPVGGTTDVMGPTTFGHNGGADAMSVGASDVRVPTALNSYSSYGPVTTLFGPVTGTNPAAALPSPVVVNKPDLVASDCNQTTFFSGASHTFCGTSAAAPHAAAVAALLRQKYPTASVAAINTAMTTTGTTIAGATAAMQGAGLLNAQAAGTAVPPPPAMPSVNSTDPASPGASTAPKVKGTADSGSTVSIYATSDCSGTPVGTGTAAAFGTPGIPVTVAAGSTTTFHALASNANGDSACSTTSATYTQLNPPVIPTVSGTDPVSPAASTTPKVKGTAAAGSTVAIYTTSDCSGPVAGTGTATQFASPGIAVTVAVGSTTTFRASASNAVGTSACSLTSTTYTQQNPPGMPTVTGTDPVSPAATTTPKVKGTADPGSTVTLYATSDCSGSPVGTGTAAAFTSPGIAVTVTTGSTTTFHARASNGGGSSACSTTSTAYTQQSPPPGTPTVSGTDPVSPAASTTPRVKGTADPGSTVTLYATNDCSGSPAGTGTAAEFTSPGIAVTVAVGSTTTFRAKASGPGGDSSCSTTSTTYTQQAAPPPPVTPPVPDTAITKAPPKTVKTTKKKAKVSFEFSSTVTGSTFTCSIDGGAFTACTSGVTYKLKAGNHTFAVRATASGVTDPTPATYAVKVKLKKKH